MPTYEFIHRIETCNHEWEEIRSITADDPTHCPKCHAEGNIIHLVSGGSGRGVVELTGQELVDKCRADAQKLKKEAARNEKVYANLLGESKYQSLQTKMDQQRRR
jgi:putative FmdB family regulatory protein